MENLKLACDAVSAVYCGLSDISLDFDAFKDHCYNVFPKEVAEHIIRLVESVR